MKEVKTKLRRWGNSFGVVIPQKAIENPRDGEDITIFVQESKPNLRKLFGAHKFSKSTEKLMNEMDEDLYND